MRVLLTNNSFALRAGSELYVRDVAIELMQRGHCPVAYSTRLGSVADELRAATVPVVRSLESLGEAPDIIHGQHHYETLTAMMWFPETPAISYCHGWLPWEEAPLRFPRILRYVAVDELCRERLIVEGGIPAERIELILNFFDKRRFPPRTPLPSSPRLALAFSNELSDSNDLPKLREACAQCGIELHAIGKASGASEPDPGRLLARYDVVFAKARSAIEAMAVGTAVVLCAPGRMGTMVSSENFALFRRSNFGIRTLSRPIEVDSLVAELRKYDPADAAAVSQAARDNCELQTAVDQILDLYQRVIDEARSMPLIPSAEAERAAARYLEQSAPHYKANSDERLSAEQRLGALQGEISALRSSATWRWTQGVLQNRLVQRLFGPVIRSVAERGTR